MGSFIIFRFLSPKVLWDDKDSSDTLPGTRRFINTFFVDQEESVTDAVVAVRLPYDRVNITGTDPFTFLSNDVVRVVRSCAAFQARGPAWTISARILKRWVK